MRLTVELIQNSLSYINPLKDRELDLRGHKIPAIENLGIAKVCHTLLFYSHPERSNARFGSRERKKLMAGTCVGTRCDRFHRQRPLLARELPVLPRLHTLLLARNRIKHIQSSLPASLPHLTTLVLTANNLTELADLDPLSGLPKLTHLVLLENPITKKEHYRSWIIWRIPSIRFLDYQKVKDAERAQARELFGESPSQPTTLASKIMGIKSRTFDVPSSAAPGADTTQGDKTVRVKLTDKERRRVERMIREAKSLAEISRLEKELNEGRIPGGPGGGVGYDDDDEDEDRMET
ncbi:L domain-like protein [Aspergillus campestris IBT 28561]|uniref:U2 small nuclear ribonucleoprotein A' n=1 Tax=Aspergillus campestris (strain IBT 28561) TaxID=1392248 RepID=A0A2I1D1H6_ASPC2|nr:L domain-like protein [Aspergillus campestris IBT 28561]PKY03729.1 L domain-like protein [Aspergillus campestris IBT 28561]